MRGSVFGSRQTAALVLWIASTTGNIGAVDDNWPQFRGPGGSGVADGAELPVEFGPSKNLLWDVATPGGVGSPCIWGDRIFVTAFERPGRKLVTLCFDRRDGLRLWRRVAPAPQIEGVHGKSSPASSTPATDGERVYVYFASYGLLAYDFTGEDVWMKPLPMPQVREGSGTSPIVVGDRLVLKVDQDRGSYMLVVDARSGDTLWRKERPFSWRSWSTPVVWREGEVDEIIALGSRQLMAYDLRDGRERWWVSGMPAHNCSTPVIGEGLLFLNGAGSYGVGDSRAPPPFETARKTYDADRDGKIKREEVPADLVIFDRGASDGAGNANLRHRWFFNMMDRDRDGALNREEWSGLERWVEMNSRFVRDAVMAIRLGGERDVTRSHVAWKDNKGVPEVPSSLYYRGRVYWIKNGGLLYCRDPQTGKVVARKRIGASGGYYASPVAGDGKIYLASDLGTVTVVKAEDGLDVLARNDLGERITATPAIVGGDLFVRTALRLSAFRRLSTRGSSLAGSDRGPAEESSVYARVDAAIDAPELLVPEGATWSFFRGKSQPGPGLEWTQPEFDDSGWESGRSGFGYGDRDDATVLSDMHNSYTTVYIRRHFDVSRPEELEELRLNVRSDDGFVAYLNGAELGRINVAPGVRVLSFQATAAGNASEPLVGSVLPVDPSRLRRGRNTLALQGLNVSLTSSDFSLIPTLGVVRKPDLERDFARLKGSISSEVPGGEGPESRYLEGRLLQKSGKRERALTEFLEVLKKDPEHLEPYLRVAETLRELGRPAEALDQVRKALASVRARSERLWSLWFTLGAMDLALEPSDLLAELERASGEGRVVQRFRSILQEAAGQGLARVPFVTFSDVRVEEAVRARLMVDYGPISRLELARIYDLTLEVDAALDLTSLEHCSELRRLRLATLRLAGTRLTFAARLTRLRQLELDGVDCGDDDLKALMELPELRRLVLKGTKVSDAGTRELRRVRRALEVQRD